MDLEVTLRGFGLHQTEIAVYLFLLKNGLSTPPVVSRETKIARTNCYNVLSELKTKGLVEELLQTKRKVYRANDPSSLVKLMEGKVANAQRVLPELKALFTHETVSPGVKFYEGLDQIKGLFESSLSTKSILSIGSRKRINLLMPDFEKHYFEEVQKRQIVFYDLTDRESKLMTAKMLEFLKGYYTVRQLPPEYEETTMDILIWEDTVALFNLKGAISAMVLKNQALSDMLQMLFKIIWKKL